MLLSYTVLVKAGYLLLLTTYCCHHINGYDLSNKQGYFVTVVLSRVLVALHFVAPSLECFALDLENRMSDLDLDPSTLKS